MGGPSKFAFNEGPSIRRKVARKNQGSPPPPMRWLQIRYRDEPTRQECVGRVVLSPFGDLMGRSRQVSKIKYVMLIVSCRLVPGRFGSVRLIASSRSGRSVQFRSFGSKQGKSSVRSDLGSVLGLGRGPAFWPKNADQTGGPNKSRTGLD